MTRPLTLPQWLAELRRRGVQVRLTDDGRVRHTGLKKLTRTEKAALFASHEQVQQLLLQRAQRRRKDEEQQHRVAMVEPQRQRRVVGQVVRPGLSLRLLYEDETTAIPAHRCRVVAVVPYGWKVGGDR